MSSHADNWRDLRSSVPDKPCSASSDCDRYILGLEAENQECAKSAGRLVARAVTAEAENQRLREALRQIMAEPDGGLRLFQAKQIARQALAAVVEE